MIIIKHSKHGHHEVKIGEIETMVGPPRVKTTASSFGLFIVCTLAFVVFFHTPNLIQMRFEAIERVDCCVKCEVGSSSIKIGISKCLWRNS